MVADHKVIQLFEEDFSSMAQTLEGQQRMERMHLFMAEKHSELASMGFSYDVFIQDDNSTCSSISPELSMIL